VALLKKAIGGGGNLFLVGLSNEIRELFDVMRLTQIFTIFSSVEDAMQAFEAETA
jgi:anti-anti-sigma regulatory factor